MSFCFPALKTARAPKTKHSRPAPAIHQNPKRSKQLEAAKSTNFYVHNVSIRFPATVNDNNIRDKIASFFTMLQHIDASLMMLPLTKEKSDLLPLLSGPSFPTERDLLRNYLTLPMFS